MTNLYQQSRFLTGPDLPEHISQLSNATIEAAIIKRIPQVSHIHLEVFSDAVGIGVIVPKFILLNGNDSSDMSNMIFCAVPASMPLDSRTLLNAIDRLEQDIKKERATIGIRGMV